MTLATTPSLFLGVTPPLVREYLQRVFTAARGQGYTRVIIPCAGRFSGTAMALKAGFKPAQIETSDIGLFSSLIGYLASGRDVRELGAQVALDWLPELGAIAAEASDPYEHAAAVMLAQRLAREKANNVYKAMIVEDLRRGWQRHYDAILDDLKQLVGRVQGIGYETRDLFEVVTDAVTDGHAILYLSPPWYGQGYTRMFAAGTQVTWHEPNIAEFAPKTGFAQLRAAIDGQPGLALILRQGAELGPDGREAVFASMAGRKVVYLLANNRAQALQLAGGVQLKIKTDSLPTPGYPLWGDDAHRIGPESVVHFQPVKREVGLYYRDMFAHGLGATDTELYVLMWLDGKVFGIVGIHGQTWRLGKDTCAFQSFAFTSRSRHYRHLSRLLMMCTTCRQFRDVIRASMPKETSTDLLGLRTACISKFPEVKSHRGLMKLVTREQRPDGRYKLSYRTDWRPGTFADQVNAWVAKYGQIGAAVDG